MPRNRELTAIRQIASGVRKWGEEQARNEFGIDPSTSYDELDECSQSLLDLAGMCARCSGRLYTELKEHGIRTIICESEYTDTSSYIDFDGNHVFLMWKEYVIDVTATQFGKYPKVMIRKLYTLSKRQWEVRRTHKDTKSLHKYQVSTGWPPDQTVDIASFSTGFIDT
jgi:hypothetical protein